MNEIKKMLGDIYEEADNILLRSNFNLDFTIDIYSFNPLDKNYERDMLVFSYMNSLRDEFNSLCETYAYSIASNTISKNIDEKSLKNHAIYCQRNYHFSNFFPRYYTLLDHIAYMIYQFSKISLIKDDRDVNIYSVRTALENSSTKQKLTSQEMIGYISLTDANKILQYISTNALYGDLDAKEIKTHRNDFVHKKFIEFGIDSNAYFYKEGNKLYFRKGKKYDFDEHINVAHILLTNLYNVINGLIKLDIAKDVLSYNN